MKEYHFSIGGEPGRLGITGTIVAPKDGDALAALQEILDDLEGKAIDADLSFRPVKMVGVVRLYTNGMTATMEMFDTIDDLDNEGK